MALKLDMRWFLALCFLIASAEPPHAFSAEHHGNTLTHQGDHRYRPSRHPDRLIIVPGEDAAHSVSINWRTSASVRQTVVQWTQALDTPGLHLAAKTALGSSQWLKTVNGAGRHHSVRLEGLQPETLYAYRVRGDGTWSEWFQFRTAPAEFKPFSFLYFGDAQNSIRSHFSRVIRQGFRDEPTVALMLHAGDLVNQRAGNHDDEWGEWFEAGGFLHGMIPTLPVSGNHEYISRRLPSGTEKRTLGPHWSRQFTIPRNGPVGFEDTVYFVRYSGVLFIVLDSMRAVDDPKAAIIQARWLDDVLDREKARWVIVSHHHPIFSVALGRDNPSLREHWLPIYERRGVDLVLQGHDHAYGRGRNLVEGRTVTQGEGGPVFVVSVAGPKQYIAAESARSGLQLIGEDMQLYQSIQIEFDRIRYQSKTVAGRVYDAFDIVYLPNGEKRVVSDLSSHTPQTRCGNLKRPAQNRCWEGNEFVN